MSINNKKYVNIRTVTDGLPEEEERSIGGGAVDSVNGKTGNVVLTGKDIKATLTTSEGQSITLPITDHLQNLVDGQDGLTNKITQIEAIIPSEASSTNPLATREDINSTGASVTAESTRAQRAEANLAADIQAETTRATAAESNLSNNITANTTAIKAETSRAESAESALSNKIDANTTQISANQTAIASEVTRATTAEQVLDGKIADNASAIDVNKAAIANEKRRAEGAETTLQNNLTAHIDNISNPHKVTKSQVGLANVDDTSDLNKPVSTAQAAAIGAAVATETTARISAINQVTDKINAIEALIPDTASPANQMADKAFVNSTVQTATANFRGNWKTWADVPTDEANYPVDYAGSKVPTVNDYLVVSDASGFTEETLQGTWRFKYSGIWATDGKAGWLPEYQVNEEPLTMAQLAALNSGVTSELLSTIQSDIATNTSSISTLETDLTTGLSEKADTSTVSAQLAEKADKTDLEALDATVTALSTTVAGKADANALGTMASKSADDYSTTLEANTLYAAKALETTVSNLGTTVSQLSTTVGTKADTSVVTELSSTVSNLSATVETKATQADLESLSQTVATKADTTTVTAELETKANKSTDFMTPLTTDNKGATKAEIDELESKIGTGGGANLKLLSRIIADFKYNDVSYLSSNTFSWQSGAVYVAAYEHLNDDLSTAGPVQTETIAGVTISFEVAQDGHRICLPDQEDNISALYTKTGDANFYILDTQNARFKLPRTQKRKLIRAVKNDDGTWYNLYSDGWVEQGGLSNINEQQALVVDLPIMMRDTNYIALCSGNIVSVVGDTETSAPAVMQTSTTQITFSTHLINPNSQGLSWQVSGYASDTVLANEPVQYEYYYVGNFEQSAIEQTAGINSEMFNSKVDVGHQVIEFQAPTAENNYTWYRKYADGWVEQGGLALTNYAEATPITMPIEMSDSNYTIFFQGCTLVDGYTGAQWHILLVNSAKSPKTATKFYAQGSIAGYELPFSWQVNGMAAN